MPLVGANLLFLRKFCKKAHCFLEICTQLAQILHVRQLLRSWQISNLQAFKDSLVLLDLRRTKLTLRFLLISFDEYHQNPKYAERSFPQWSGSSEGNLPSSDQTPFLKDNDNDFVRFQIMDNCEHLVEVHNVKENGTALSSLRRITIIVLTTENGADKERGKLGWRRGIKADYTKPSNACNG